MPTINLACASIGTHDAWTLLAGATKVIAVAAPDDDGTTRIGISVLNAKQSFNMDNLPAGSASVSTVDLIARMSESGVSAITARAFVLLSGTIVNGATRAVTSTWTTYTDLAIARPGGGTWTPADVNAMEVGVEEDTDSADSVLCTTLYSTVAYTVGSGDYAIFIASWLPPLLALASHGLTMVDVRHMARALRHLKHHPSNDEDFRRLLEGFRLRPRYA